MHTYPWKERTTRLINLDPRAHGASVAQVHRVRSSGGLVDRLHALMLRHDILLLPRTEVMETTDGGHLLEPCNTECCWEIGLQYVQGCVNISAGC